MGQKWVQEHMKMRNDEKWWEHMNQIESNRTVWPYWSFNVLSGFWSWSMARARRDGHDSDSPVDSIPKSVTCDVGQCHFNVISMLLRCSRTPRDIFFDLAMLSHRILWDIACLSFSISDQPVPKSLPWNWSNWNIKNCNHLWPLFATRRCHKASMMCALQRWASPAAA